MLYTLLLEKQPSTEGLFTIKCGLGITEKFHRETVDFSPHSCVLYVI